MVVLLSVHPSRQQDLRSEHKIEVSPRVVTRDGLDPFGNIWTRFVAPAGRIEIRNDFLIEDSGQPDESAPAAQQWGVNDLPDEVLPFLYGSRYCDTQRLTNLAWSLFGPIASGWQRVQAISDYVDQRIQFGYHHARSDRTASEGYEERVGVCRDFAHLAVALCRCMNIPARYCTGYLGDSGVPKDPAPMDFSAWFEVYLDGTLDEPALRLVRPLQAQPIIDRPPNSPPYRISSQMVRRSPRTTATVLPICRTFQSAGDRHDSEAVCWPAWSIELLP
ncbi:transglutaminase-like putative cysteine protease [Bradyrhizobium sp. OAE829]